LRRTTLVNCISLGIFVSAAILACFYGLQIGTKRESIVVLFLLVLSHMVENGRIVAAQMFNVSAVTYGTLASAITRGMVLVSFGVILYLVVRSISRKKGD
jgi:hypothetical protein